MKTLIARGAKFEGRTATESTPKTRAAREDHQLQAGVGQAQLQNII